ncbi:DUF3307 domain-containing protein [Cryptosporangium phraense]|uniref:DUF3307 domain-containing protein n=1 Tax=Cryptosporangium phraense TaxID=2593070 RepID=A0A545ASR4_9ACTN|nr:DUF3307 domain-containing protein [Cryptosporangium phraense]TQS44343.1 DUF3307 domain-containing protein [Cryptosporangium phraense]
MNRGGTFAAAGFALLAGHQAGDHLVQTDHQAQHKASDGAKGWRAMAGHVASYTACQAVALAGLSAAGVKLRPSRALAALAVSAGTHAFIDRRWPVVWWQDRTGSGPFVRLADHGINGAYLSDQAAHVVCLYVAALVAAA